MGSKVRVVICRSYTGRAVYDDPIQERQKRCKVHMVFENLILFGFEGTKLRLERSNRNTRLHSNGTEVFWSDFNERIDMGKMRQVETNRK